MSEEQKCEHPVTEAGKCITCGEPFAAPRWTMEELLKDADRTSEFDKVFLPNFENLGRIAKLADEAWAEYDRLATENETPGFPQMPRMRLIGGRISRKPFHQIWQEVVGPAYDKAVSMGYRGDYHKWQQFVKESNRE